jgi:hypothetical protein
MAIGQIEGDQRSRKRLIGASRDTNYAVSLERQSFGKRAANAHAGSGDQECSFGHITPAHLMVAITL